MSATTTVVRWSVHMGSLERQNEVNLLLTCLKFLFCFFPSGIVSHLLSMNHHLIVVEGFVCPRDPRSHVVWASLACWVLHWQPGPWWGARLSAVQEDLPAWRRDPAAPRHRLRWDKTWWCVFSPAASGLLWLVQMENVQLSARRCGSAAGLSQKSSQFIGVGSLKRKPESCPLLSLGPIPRVTRGSDVVTYLSQTRTRFLLLCINGGRRCLTHSTPC